MWFIYYVSISTLGDYCIGFIETTFENIGDFITTKLPELGASELVTSLVNDGIVQPIGSIFTFVPQLMLLFFFLSLLEDSGIWRELPLLWTNYLENSAYLVRVSYLCL